MAATSYSDARSNAFELDSSHHPHSRIVRVVVNVGDIVRNSENRYDGGYTSRDRGALDLLWPLPRFAHASLAPEKSLGEKRFRPKVPREFCSPPIGSI